MPWIHKDVAWHLINVILTLPDFFSRVSILLQECHGVKEASSRGINEIYGRVINIYLDAMGQERLAQCAMAKEISKAIALPTYPAGSKVFIEVPWGVND